MKNKVYIYFTIPIGGVFSFLLITLKMFGLLSLSISPFKLVKVQGVFKLGQNAV